MRKIERTGSFNHDFKRVKATPRHRDIEAILVPVLQLLMADQPLPQRLSDHPLIGDWKDHRDCHLKPDLVLIYREPEVDVLLELTGRDVAPCSAQVYRRMIPSELSGSQRVARQRASDPIPRSPP